MIFLSLRISKGWIRYPSFGISMLLFLLAGLVLYVDGCETMNSYARIPGIISPDGNHVAVVRWFMPGALGSDEVQIFIRGRFSPVATKVESGGGEPKDDPKVQWLDNRRLLITYWEKGEIKPCSPGPDRVKGIEVLCRD
jgi:hypothetical protein